MWISSSSSWYYSFLEFHFQVQGAVANLGRGHPDETPKAHMTVQSIFNDPAHINMFRKSSIFLDEEIQDFLH